MESKIVDDIAFVDEKFERAAEFFGKQEKDVSNDLKLHLYALYKVAKVGECHAERPGVWDFVGRAKYDAWKKLGDMDQLEAKKRYVGLIGQEFGADWDSSGKSGDQEFFLFQTQEMKQAASSQHAFWDTQPLPNKWGQEVQNEEDADYVDESIGDNVSPVPLPLPPGIEWKDSDWKDESLDVICNEVEILSHSVKDENESSFQPPFSFLVHSFSSPSFRKEYLVGLKDENGMLVGFICAIPFSLQIHKSTLDKCVEVKNLYLHPKVRGKRLTPILIAEITRRVTYNGTITAFYTSSVTITRPLCKARYYQRLINVAKLVSVNYKELARGSTIPRLQAKMELESNPLSSKNWRKLKDSKDVSEAYQLLCDYLEKFAIHQTFTMEEFVHWFVKSDSSVQVYVAGKEKVEAFAAWQVMFASHRNNSGFDTHIAAAFNHYCAIDEKADFELSDLFNAQLAQARDDDVDVFLSLDIGGNDEFLSDFYATKAEVTPEYLLYHLYNFKSPPCGDVDRFNVQFF